ncbi:uncharacterized protein N7483_001959 [Penicillium malachiteum]|uniref:uncharacterized protein n=1 Tax=Penicillium malachiteum TaxID=1324776 RepID=UPI002547F9E2|nr:uncharacterized protein N7483_001959 [Penicillium malachiteum]KAJ5736834.1 hypothetical protein N7483_001959 [Penicillium malachiteum]
MGGRLSNRNESPDFINGDLDIDLLFRHVSGFSCGELKSDCARKFVNSTDMAVGEREAFESRGISPGYGFRAHIRRL